MQTIQKTELKAAADGSLGTGQSEAKQRAGEPKGLKVRAMLRARLGEDIFSSWFHALEFDGFDGKIVKVSVPVKFLKTWIQSHYSQDLLECCRAEFKGAERVEVVLRQLGGAAAARCDNGQAAQVGSGDGANGSRTTVRTEHGQRMAGIMSPAQSVGRTSVGGFEGSPLDPRLSFATFVVGTTNRLAHAAAQEVAGAFASPQQLFNPLFVRGNVGLGKTHLLHAIAWDVKQRRPEARVLYLTAERFMSGFVQALRARDALAFKDKLRKIDILLIDDMEFLQGPTIQQEFCHTLNSLIDGGRQVVVAADRGPTQLDKLDMRMRSRLGGGLVAEIGPMDYDLRHKILSKRATEACNETSGLGISDTVLAFLAERLTESGRELEGSIHRLRASFQLTDQPVTLEVAEQIVRDLMRGAEPRRVRIDDILRTVSKHYGVNRGDLLSGRRNRSIVRPRQIGMYLAKLLTSRSLPEIGRRFGNRDHTTVLHAIRKVEQLMNDDNQLREEVELLKRLLRD